MNAAAPPPPKDPRDKQVPQTTATLALPTEFSPVLGGLAILPIVFLIVFHSGAAYLSYQKYQSGLWALLDFIFAYFYYPYYAFFLSSAPGPAVAPSPINAVMGGLRKMMGGRRR